MDSVREDDRRPNLIRPVGYKSSRCGYCKTSKSSKSYGIWGYLIKADAYEKLIEHGWRRSGNYIYRPDCGMNGTCCPQIAIRLDVDEFRPTRQQRRSIAAADRILRTSKLDNGVISSASGSYHHSARARGKFSRPWDVERSVAELESLKEDESQRSSCSSESGLSQTEQLNLQHEARSQQARRARKGLEEPLRPLLHPRQHNLRTSLYVASSSEEKYGLFRKYQADVHKEAQEQISKKSGFERFLCEAPFPDSMEEHVKNIEQAKPVDLESSEPISYGLYHMEWRLDGKLIALGVLDILPRYVSSVYLIYDPQHADLQLGKISALREIALVKQLRRKNGMQSLRYYTMGLYIHGCAKMRYKAQYGPAQLLDPLTNEWYPFAQLKDRLDSGQRFDFSNASGAMQDTSNSNTLGKTSASTIRQDESDEEDGDELPIPPPPGVEDPDRLTHATLSRCLIFRDGRPCRLVNELLRMTAYDRKLALECASALNSLKSHFVFML